MARQLNVTCNFNTRYLIRDIPENTVEIVVKIKTTFSKHTLMEDQERSTVKYRPWRRQNQPKIRMDTKKRVAPLKVRRMKKDGTELGTFSDSGTWVLEEGLGYLLKVFTDPNYPQTSEEEGVKEAHPHNKTDNNATPDDYNSVNEAMSREEAPICTISCPRLKLNSPSSYLRRWWTHPKKTPCPTPPDQKTPKPCLNAWSQTGKQISTRFQMTHPNLTMTIRNPNLEETPTDHLQSSTGMA